MTQDWEHRKAVLRERLQAQLRAAQRERAAVEERLGAPETDRPDTGDPLQDRWEDSPGRLDMIQTRIADLQQALHKLEQDDYGFCESCGRPIAVERLEALPQTTLCIECARRKEQEETGA